MATLVIKHTGTGGQSNNTAPDSVLYNSRATLTSLGERCEVWLDLDNDPINPSDAFGNNLGQYDLATSSWDLYGPDGIPVQLAPGSGNPTSAGTVANPQTFTPTTPGRWLVRVAAQPWIADQNGNVVLGTVKEFTVLFEIQDPNVIGHPNAEHPGTTPADWSVGTSAIAANETVEYDQDEGWSRSVERYLNTVSKTLGGRRLAVGINKSTLGGNPIVAPTDIGRPVTLSADSLARWKKVDGSLEEFQNFTLQFDYIDATMAVDVVQSSPIFLTLHDNVPYGERSYLLVDGVIPFDTFTINNGAAASVGDRVYLSDTGELTTDIGQIADPTKVRVLGEVVHVGTDTPSGDFPGAIWFHGSTPMLPGVVSGPLSSQDNHIVRWDGVTGQKVKDSDVQLEQVGKVATFQATTAAIDKIHLLPGNFLGTPHGLFVDGSADDGANNPLTKLGLNTDAPTALFTIAGAGVAQAQEFFAFSDATGKWVLATDFSLAGKPVVVKTSGHSSIMSWQTTDYYRVGIGTSSPQTKLHLLHDGAGAFGEPVAVRLEASSPTPGAGAIGAKLQMVAHSDLGATPNSTFIQFGDTQMDAAGGIKYDNTYALPLEHSSDLMTFSVARDNLNTVNSLFLNSYGAMVWNDLAAPLTFPDANISFIVNGQSQFGDTIHAAGDIHSANTITAGNKVIGGDVYGLNNVESTNDVIAGANVEAGLNVEAGQDLISQGGLQVTNEALVGGDSAFGGPVVPGKKLSVYGDVKITGVLDPTGLVFTEEDPANVPVNANEAALLVSDGTNYNGSPTVQGTLYFKDAAGNLTEASGGGAGGGIASPGVTYVDGLVTWSAADGSSVRSVHATLTPFANAFGGEDFDFVFGDDGYAGPAPTGVVLRAADNTQTQANGDLNTSANFTIQAGNNLGDALNPAGYLYLRAGSSNLGTAGDTIIEGGSSQFGAGWSTTGGSVSVNGGVGDSGGSVLVRGGPGKDVGGSGGKVEIFAGSSDGSPGDISIVSGGTVSPNTNVSGAPVTIQGGEGDDAVGNIANGGDVSIFGGEGAGFGGQLSKGGSVKLTGGAAFRGGDIEIYSGSGLPGGVDGAVTIGTSSNFSKMTFSGDMIGINCLGDDPNVVPAGKLALPANDPLANRLSIDGSISVTGLIDPVGIILKPGTSNPSDRLGSLLSTSTVWMDESHNIRMGENVLGTGLARNESIWQTALNCTVKNAAQGTLGADDGPEWTDPLSGNSYIVHYGAFGGSSESDGTHNAQSIVLPYAAQIVGVSYRYNDRAPFNNVSEGDGKLVLRLGVANESQSLSAEPAAFANLCTWQPVSQVIWETTGADPYPQTHVTDMSIAVQAGQSIALQVLEEGNVLDSGAEITCVIWLKGLTQNPSGGGWTDVTVVDESSGSPASPYVVVDSDRLILADLSNDTSDVVVQLPDATNYLGRVITVKDSKGLSGETFEVVVKTPLSTQYIDGDTELRFVAAYASASFVSDGSNWLVL